MSEPLIATNSIHTVQRSAADVAAELELLKARHEFWKWMVQFTFTSLLQVLPLVTTLVVTWRNGDRAVNIERKVDAVEKKIEDSPAVKVGDKNGDGKIDI